MSAGPFGFGGRLTRGGAFLGAGVFGFIITTPVINYYEHSTYLTMNHGHTALFGSARVESTTGQEQNILERVSSSA